MMPRMATRHRPTEIVRETARRTVSISIALGRQLAAGRRRLALTQRALAARTGISQSAYSRIERGLGARAPLETWVALGIAVDRPLAVTFTRPLGEGVGLGATADAGHLSTV